jgi:hypothetical protein
MGLNLKNDSMGSGQKTPPYFLRFLTIQQVFNMKNTTFISTFVPFFFALLHSNAQTSNKIEIGTIDILRLLVSICNAIT